MMFVSGDSRSAELKYKIATTSDYDLAKSYGSFDWWDL